MRGDAVRLAFPAVVVAVIALAGSVASGARQPAARPLDTLAVLLLVAAAAALLARRRWPLTTLLTTAAFLVLYLAVGYPYGPSVLPFVVALVTSVIAGSRPAVWLIAATSYAGIIASIWIRDGRPGWWTVSAIAAWLLLVITAAELLRSRIERRHRDRRERREAARRQATEERLRIARELHDVLAHHVSLINVQAGSALHLLDRDPEVARDALATIKASSKEVLVELRGLLRTLRDPADDTDTAPRSPVAGLAGLDELAERMRSVGIAVTLRRDGPARPLPATVDAAAFRIVQESLTNVHRHSRADTASVLVEYGPERLTVRVDDPGPPVASASDNPTGTGIAGMRERASALGGRFSAGTRPGGGFRVDAEFPLGRPGGST